MTDQRGEAFETMRKAGVPDRSLGDAYRNFWLPVVKQREATHGELVGFLPWAMKRLGFDNPARYFNVRNGKTSVSLRTALSEYRKLKPRKGQPSTLADIMRQIGGGV